MRRFDCVKCLLLTFTFGLICGQNSLQFGDYNSYNGYDYGSDHLIEGNDEPKKIGELEFDVEVAEQTPRPGERVPEVLVNNDYYEDSNENTKGMTAELPVELMSESAQIGNLEFDIEVADNQKMNSSEDKSLNDDRQAFPSDPRNGKRPRYFAQADNDTDSSNDMTSTTAVANETSSEENPVNLPDPGTQQPIPVATSGSYPPPERPPPNPDGQKTDPPDTKEEKEKPEPKPGPKSTETWPIYVIGVILVVLSCIGVIWAIWRLCIVVKTEDDLEKRAAAAEKRGPPEDEHNERVLVSSSDAGSDEVDSVRSGINASPSSRPPSKDESEGTPPKQKSGRTGRGSRDQERKQSKQSKQSDSDDDKSEESLKQIRLREPDNSQDKKGSKGSKGSDENVTADQKTGSKTGSQKEGSFIGSQQPPDSL